MRRLEKANFLVGCFFHIHGVDRAPVVVEFHVRLTGTEPNFTGQDIVDGNLLFATAERNRVGAANLGRSSCKLGDSPIV